MQATVHWTKRTQKKENRTEEGSSTYIHHHHPPPASPFTSHITAPPASPPAHSWLTVLITLTHRHADAEHTAAARTRRSAYKSTRANDGHSIVLLLPSCFSL